MALRISSVSLQSAVSSINPLPANYVPTAAAAAALTKRVSYQNGVALKEQTRNALNGLGELVQVVT